MSQLTPYARQIIVALTELNNEGNTTLAADLDGNDVPSELRRKAFDGAVTAIMSHETIKLFNAFEMAGVSVGQAAKVMYLADVLSRGGE